MAKALDKQVEELLQEGMSKETIFKKLKTPDNSAKLVFFLNNKSLISRRKTYMWMNLLLAAMLLGMTLKRLLAISASSHFDFLLLFDFIVPTIHFYILRELLQSGELGDLDPADITKAKQKIHSAIHHERQSKKSLRKSVKKLERAVSILTDGNGNGPPEDDEDLEIEMIDTDINGDGVIDAQDFAILTRHWLETTP